MLKLRPLGIWLASSCLVGFFFPYFQHTTFQGVTDRKFTLGMPFSPWIIASWKEAEEARTEKAEDGTVRSAHSRGFSSSVNVEIISWSSLLGVVGFGLLEVKRRLRPNVTSQGS
jgi:hypothetical protein